MNKYLVTSAKNFGPVNNSNEAIARHEPIGDVQKEILETMEEQESKILVDKLLSKEVKVEVRLLSGYFDPDPERVESERVESERVESERVESVSVTRKDYYENKNWLFDYLASLVELNQWRTVYVRAYNNSQNSNPFFIWDILPHLFYKNGCGRFIPDKQYVQNVMEKLMLQYILCIDFPGESFLDTDFKWIVEIQYYGNLST